MGVYSEIHIEMAIAATPQSIKEILGNVPSLLVKIYYRDTYESFLLQNIKPEKDTILQYLMMCSYYTKIKFTDYILLQSLTKENLHNPQTYLHVQYQFNTLLNNGRNFRKLVGDIGIQSLHLTYGVPVRAEIMLLEKIKVEYIERLCTGEHKIRLHNYNDGQVKQLTVTLPHLTKENLTPLASLLKVISHGQLLYKREGITKLNDGILRFLGNQTIYELYNNLLHKQTVSASYKEMY